MLDFFLEIMLYGRYCYSHFIGCNILSHLSFSLYSIIFIVFLLCIKHLWVTDKILLGPSIYTAPALRDLTVYLSKKIKRWTIKEIITIKCVKNTEMRDSLGTMEPAARDLLSPRGDQKTTQWKRHWSLIKNKRKKLMNNKQELYVHFHLFLSQILILRVKK